eukprot:jgi/Tetstr1/444120/TSEL_032019.t1
MAEQVRALLQQGHAKLESGDVGGALQRRTDAGHPRSDWSAWNAGVRSRADVDDLHPTCSLPSRCCAAAARFDAAILAETGREGITQCAMDDGSSYMCRACGGLVPRGRQEHHDRFWCQPPS